MRVDANLMGHNWVSLPSWKAWQHLSYDCDSEESIHKDDHLIGELALVHEAGIRGLLKSPMEKKGPNQEIMPVITP